MEISLGKETSANNKTSSYQYYCHCPPLIAVLLPFVIRDQIGNILFAYLWKWRFGSYHYSSWINNYYSTFQNNNFITSPVILGSYFQWRIFFSISQMRLKRGLSIIFSCVIYTDGESGLFINFSHAAISQVWYNHNTLLQYYNRRVLTQTIHYQEPPILVWYSQSILLTNTHHNKIYLKWSV